MSVVLETMSCGVIENPGKWGGAHRFAVSYVPKDGATTGLTNTNLTQLELLHRMEYIVDSGGKILAVYKSVPFTIQLPTKAKASLTTGG